MMDDDLSLGEDITDQESGSVSLYDTDTYDDEGEGDYGIGIEMDGGIYDE